MNTLPPHGPIGLIVNTRARAVKRRYLRRPFWADLVPALRVRLTASLEDLDQAIADFQNAGIGTVAALGGDGSLHCLIDVVLHRYEEPDAPVILPLAGGTMNGLVKALGSGGPPGRVLRTALAGCPASVPVRTRRVLRVTDERARRDRYGISLAAGLVYRAFERYYRRAEPGLVDAVRASMLPVTSAILRGAFFEDVRLEVESEGGAWLPGPVHTLVASVVDNPVLWFRPFGAPLGDADAFHLGATTMRPREIVPRLWSIFQGRCNHPRLRVDRTVSATVRGNTGYVIDGDLYDAGGALSLRLTLGPRIRFLVPSPRRPRSSPPPSERAQGFGK